MSFEENGAIPLFEIERPTQPEWINIGTVGGMNRLSTGYTYLNIQKHSRFLCEHLDSLHLMPRFQIDARYRMLDRIFLRVLKRNPALMPQVFWRFFAGESADTLPFLANQGTVAGDLATILKMPKLPFLRAVVGG